MLNEKKPKFFTKRWYFWLVVFLNWVRQIITTRPVYFLEYVGSLVGSFIFIFICALIIWIISIPIKKWLKRKTI